MSETLAQQHERLMLTDASYKFGYDTGAAEVERLRGLVQGAMAEALPMMVAFKKYDIPWDWESTEENLKRIAESMVEP